MRKLIVNYIITLSSLLWLNSLAHSGMIEDKVKEAIATIKTNDNGRKALLEEMSKYPAQLEADIHRMGSIKVHDIEILTKEINDMANIDNRKLSIYDSILTKLKQHCPKDIACNNNIGPFSPAEIMFSSVQNFLTQPMTIFMNKPSSEWTTSGEWGSPSGQSTLNVAIKFKKHIANKNDLLEVIYISIKTYVDMLRKNLPNRSVTYETTTTFNLSNGTVKFMFKHYDTVSKQTLGYEFDTLDTDEILKSIK